MMDRMRQHGTAYGNVGEEADKKADQESDQKADRKAGRKADWQADAGRLEARRGRLHGLCAWPEPLLRHAEA
jgi:hypothetical protein